MTVKLVEQMTKKAEDEREVEKESEGGGNSESGEISHAQCVPDPSEHSA